MSRLFNANASLSWSMNRIAPSRSRAIKGPWQRSTIRSETPYGVDQGADPASGDRVFAVEGPTVNFEELARLYKVVVERNKTDRST